MVVAVVEMGRARVSMVVGRGGLGWGKIILWKGR